MNLTEDSKSSAFTIVELLIVIVIIGILASIIIVNYTGIIQRVTIAAMQSDLLNAKNKFELYYAEHNVYPTGLNENNCPTNANVTPSPDTNYCLKLSNNNTIILNSGNNGNTYTLRLTKDYYNYAVTNSTSPQPTIALDTNWLTIGSQTWAKTNLNIGTMVDGTVAQTDNGTIEKYCYNNDEANCTTYGALYQWNEAMNYSTIESAQGICPVGAHIPSDNNWKILEMQLGMSQAQADITADWRGTNQGTQLKSSGTSGLDFLLGGYRFTDGTFSNLSSYADLWSSSGVDASAWSRYLYTTNSTVGHYSRSKANGFSIRCLAN